MAIFSKKTPTPKKVGTEEKNKPAVKAKKEETKSMKELYGAAEETKIKPAKGVESKGNYAYAYRIISKPLVTEKVSGLGALNKYVFAVAKNTNKIEVAKAVRQIYGIKPLSVNIIKIEGKQARYGRTKGKRKDWKKAIVTLPSGQTIKVYEGV